MQDALIAIKDGSVPSPSVLPSFQEIKDTLGFNRYYKEEKQYQVVSYDIHLSYSVYNEHYVNMQFPNHVFTFGRTSERCHDSRAANRL